MTLPRRDFLGILAAIAASPAFAATATTRPTTDSASTLTSLNWDGKPATKKHKVDPIDEFFDAGPLPRLHLEVDPSDLRQLDQDPKTPVRGELHETAPGEPDRYYYEVAVTLKGSYGSRRPTTDKPALTLNFDKFVDRQHFHGLDKVHLNNSVQDGSYMCENLGGWIFRECGLPSPRVTAGRLWLNDRDLGAYVLKEGFDRPFFKRYFNDPTGDAYESNFSDITGNLNVHLGGPKLPAIDPNDFPGLQRREQELNVLRAKAWNRLRALATACRVPDAADRMAALARVLDVDRCLTFLAGEAMIAHWDGYATARNNYRLYHNPSNNLLVFLPGGMDQLFQRPEHSLYGNNSLVPLAITENNPAGRKRYLDRVAEIRRGAFKNEALLARFDKVKARLEPLFDEIGAEAVKKHTSRVKLLRNRIIERCDVIDRQLIAPPKPLKFDENGVAALTVWRPAHQDDFGDAECDQFEENGKQMYRVTCKAPGGAASWRCSELLPAGTYTFTGRMKTVGVTVAHAAGSSQNGLGATIRISGSRRASRVTGDTEWQTVSYAFSVSTAIKGVAFVCELSAGQGQAIFDASSLKVQRQQEPQRPQFDNFIIPRRVVEP
jgi:hypothetical protein